MLGLKRKAIDGIVSLQDDYDEREKVYEKDMCEILGTDRKESQRFRKFRQNSIAHIIVFCLQPFSKAPAQRMCAETPMQAFSSIPCRNINLL